jgi:O-acetyl-ADP-ribose deacetylase (regulator of RNase III)
VIAASIVGVVCIASLVLGLQRRLVGRRHALLAFAWLCAAIAATLVIFSYFPQSSANGSVLGISVGGAAAFVVVIFLLGVRVQRQMLVLDQPELLLAEKDNEIAQLTEELETLRQHHAPRPLQGQLVHHYSLGEQLKDRIAIVTGDLRNIDFADVWVNSENVDMQMSRFHEKSVSGLIRYGGAERDGSGRVTDDLVADELARKVGNRTPVTAGTVVVTGAGKLCATNHVRHIMHAAAVQGEPAIGYRQVRSVGRCVREALRQAEHLGGDEHTIVFPLLGTGEGAADPAATARDLIGAAVDYLVGNPASKVRTVFFLAYTDRELSACQAAVRAAGLSGS